jgi:hypothetical protein
LSSPAKPALMLDPPQSSTTTSLRTTIAASRATRRVDAVRANAHRGGWSSVDESRL